MSDVVNLLIVHRATGTMLIPLLQCYTTLIASTDLKFIPVYNISSWLEATQISFLISVA
jgi:hypothetical protein